MYNTIINEKICVNNINVERRTCDLTPWQKAPYQLISWWDMQRFSAIKFYNMSMLLERLRTQYHLTLKTLTNSFSVDEDLRIRLARLLCLIEDECFELSLPNAMGAISEFRRDLLAWKIEDIILGDIASRLDEIERAIRREMKLHLFMYISVERTEYYDSYRKTKGAGVGADNPTRYLFGESVNDKFPSASFDIKEAGNCFATDRYTACVFHLMRVLEIGLVALAKVFNVPSDHINWHVIIEGIENKIRDMGKIPNKAANWKDDQEFYAQAANHFMFLKDAWRNYTAHGRGKFGDEEAETILRNVRAFMQKLATKISEKV